MEEKKKSCWECSHRTVCFMWRSLEKVFNENHYFFNEASGDYRKAYNWFPTIAEFCNQFIQKI